MNHSPEFDYTGSVALVTGAGRGIGLEIARAYARAGAAVVVHYHHENAEVMQAIQAFCVTYPRCRPVQADLTLPQDVERLFAAVERDFQCLDVLINNAGSYPVTGLMNLSMEEWRQVLDINLTAVFACVQRAAQIMLRQDRPGAIVNIGSIEAVLPVSGHAHYNSAKAGLLMLTRNAAQELGPYQIRVNTVSPGLIDKGHLQQDWPQGVQRWLNRVPLGSLGAPADVANACLFLTSPLARWITGAELVVDGGMLAQGWM